MFLFDQRRPAQPIISRIPPTTIVPIAEAYLNLMARTRCTIVRSENTTVYATVDESEGVYPYGDSDVLPLCASFQDSSAPGVSVSVWPLKVTVVSVGACA